MFRLRDAFVLIVLFLACAQTAHAFIDPPWITPADPRAGEIVSVNIRMGICDAIAEEPGYPQITQEGNAIRIIEFGTHQSLKTSASSTSEQRPNPLARFHRATTY